MNSPAVALLLTLLTSLHPAVDLSLPVAPAATTPDTRAAPDTLAGPAAIGRGAWLWPIEPRPEIISEFEAPATRYSAGHRGLDLAVSPGVQLRAPADGVVAFTGTVVDRPVVSVDHAHGVRSTFEPAVSLVTAGTLVARGQPLAVVATGGHCADHCLHLGARLNGGYINPRLLLTGIPRAVLLPVEAAIATNGSHARIGSIGLIASIRAGGSLHARQGRSPFPAGWNRQIGSGQADQPGDRRLGAGVEVRVRRAGAQRGRRRGGVPW